MQEEFQKYGEAVQKARTRLEQASGDLDFIDTRARALSRKLRDVGEDAPALAEGTRINLAALHGGRLRGYT